MCLSGPTSLTRVISLLLLSYLYLVGSDHFLLFYFLFFISLFVAFRVRVGSSSSGNSQVFIFFIYRLCCCRFCWLEMSCSFSFYLESGFGLRSLVCFIREAQMLILRALIFHGAETAEKVGVLMMVAASSLFLDLMNWILWAAFGFWCWVGFVLFICWGWCSVVGLKLLVCLCWVNADVIWECFWIFGLRQVDYVSSAYKCFISRSLWRWDGLL